MKPIGILGGTFDPVHYGHLRLAMEMVKRLELDELRFIPLHNPPHRDAPHASPEQRHAMLQLATRDIEHFHIDTRELDRKGISYTIDTVKSLREGKGYIPICLVMGMDAFKGIDTWRQWRDLPGFVHIVIADRPGATLANITGAIRELVDHRRIEDYTLLHENQAGKILHLPIPLLDISSTRIRKMIARQEDCRFLLPDDVLDYIHTYHLYQDCK